MLPDLYRAVEAGKVKSQYRFVTEGERGRWQNVEDFFRKLPASAPAGSCLEAIDNAREIKFGRFQKTDGSTETFWGDGPYTERRLFQKIVDTLRERSIVAAESYEETCRKTWTLIKGFQFVGAVTHDTLRTQLDHWLLARIGPADRLSEKRDHLLLDLARQACAGNAHIAAKDFLAAHGLADTPLTNWAQLSEKTRQHLGGILRRKRIDMAVDIRPTLTDDALRDWTTSSPLLVISGVSGSGKTWHGYRVLLQATQDGDVVILVDSRGDADRDLTEASSTFWHQIVGVDESVPFSRLRARLRQLSQMSDSRRVTVLVDNVLSAAEAQRLVEEDWETWGVRLAITCPPQVASIIRQQIGNRGREIRVQDYSLSELQLFISSVVGIAWEDVPFDVQKTIRRPLLAELFGKLVAEVGWKPQNEFDLYEQAWKLLRDRGIGAFDLDGLRKASLRVLANGCGYPWSASELGECMLSAEAVERFVSAGWFHETTSGDFEVWHDRLLNWTVAEALVHELERDSDNSGAHIQTIAKLLQEPRVANGRSLNSVPLDVMWLLSAKADNELFLQLVTACETVLGWQAKETLHEELLPTLGSRAVPLLLARLLSSAETGPQDLVSNLINGLAATGDEGVRRYVPELLTSTSPKVRRAGSKLLSKLPLGSVLDQLWSIHVEGVHNPEPFLWPNSPKFALYEDTFAALKACVALNLPWLEKNIQDADPATAPVYDLAYLVAAVGNEGVWHRNKKTLIAKVDGLHERAIASCILTFRDRDEFAWLESRVAKTEDLVGMVALRALIVMEPNRALASLERMNENMLYLTRHSCFAELYLHLPSQVMAHFTAKLLSHERPLHYALVLQGQEDLIDTCSYDFLLDRLAAVIPNSIGPDRDKNAEADRRLGMSFVNDITHPDILNRLRNRRGGGLETNLAEFAIALGPQEGEWKVHDKFDALEALARIGGDGFNRVLDLWLEKAGWGGRIHAVQMSQRRVTRRTIEILTKLSETGGVGDDEQRRVLSGYAAASLASHRYWAPVIRYNLRVGIGGLTVVDDCFPKLEQPLDDTLLAQALVEFRGEHGPTPGSVICLGIAGRHDLLPEIRLALEKSTLGSDLAVACLLALQRLNDTESSIVSIIARHLVSSNFHAINALFANGSSAALAELASELQRRPEIQLAVKLANYPQYRHAGIEAIRQLVTNVSLSKAASGIATVVELAEREVLVAIADWPELYSLAEEIGYSSYEPTKIDVENANIEKQAAIRIVGIKQPDAAMRVSLKRLCDPDTPNREWYVPLIAAVAGDKATNVLLESAKPNSPMRVMHAIGRELCRLGAENDVLQMLRSSEAEDRIVACRIAGFLRHSDLLDAEVQARIIDVSKRVSDAAVKARKRLSFSRIAESLERAIADEHDNIHLWVLLDAIVSVADPDLGDSVPGWFQRIKRYLTPSMVRYVSEVLEDRRKKLNQELDSADG